VPTSPTVKVFVFHAIFSKLPTLKALFFVGIFFQLYQLLKFWCLLGLLTKSTKAEGFVFCWHFCPNLLMVKVLAILATVTFLATLAMNDNSQSYVIWSFPLSNICYPTMPHTSSHSPEAISGTPLCKQVFLIQEATVGMG